MRKLEYLQKILAQRQQGSSAKKCREYKTEHTETKKRKERLIDHESSCDLQFGSNVQASHKWQISTGPAGSYVINKDYLLFRHGQAWGLRCLRRNTTHCVGQKGFKKKWVWSEILQRNLCKGSSGALCVGGKLHSSIRAGICSATWHLCRRTRAVGWLMRRPTLCWHMHTPRPHQYLTQTRTPVRLSWAHIRTCRLQMKLLAHTSFHT